LQRSVLRYLLERDVGGSFYAVKDQHDPRQRPGGYIPWRPAAFLGHAPTSSPCATPPKYLRCGVLEGVVTVVIVGIRRDGDKKDVYRMAGKRLGKKGGQL
jgi:hypothetical protein